MNPTGIKQGPHRTGSTTYYRQQRLIAWRRDRGICAWCGRRPHFDRCTPQGCDLCYEADHIQHVSNGGLDHHSNLVVACRACNQARSTHDTPRKRFAAATAEANPMAGVRRPW